MSVRFTYDSPARRGNTRTSECFASSSALPNPGSLFPFLVALCILGSVSGCDHQSPESFSVNVTVENEDGDPVEAAKVGVRPCYRVGCAGNARSVHRDGRTKAVTLASFSGAADGKEVILKWKTEEEKENAGFLIKRKREGEFEEVDFVEGVGTTSQPQSYRYRDLGRAPGEHTYRLVVIDIEGNKRETDPVSVNIDGTEGTAVQPTFPNPFSAQTTLAIEVGEPATVRSTVHRLNGKQVATLVDTAVRVGRHTYTWPKEDRHAGLYQIRTRVQVDNQTVVRDTGYAAYAGNVSDAAPIGTTSGDGTVSTTNRARFPGLYDIPKIDVRGENGGDLGTISGTSPRVQFVVTTREHRHTFERRIGEGTNDITLTIAR